MARPSSVLVPRPSYPLFEHLTRLEGVRAEPYDLEYHGRWEIDFDRFAVAPDDVKRVAAPVLRHRVLANFAAEAEGVGAERVIEEVLSRVSAPKADIRF